MESVVTREDRPGSTAAEDSAANRFSVALIDDHPVFTGALAAVLSIQPDVSRVWTAANLDEGRRLIQRERPDLAVIDARLDREDGLALVSELPGLSASTRAVVLTAHPQPAIVRRARSLGAAAVLPKGTGLAEVLDALRAVAIGEPLKLDTTPEGGAEHSLTWRETQVLQLLADGRDPQQVARLLELSTHTVRDHIRSVREKLGVQTVLAAVVEGARLGVVEVHVH